MLPSLEINRSMRLPQWSSSLGQQIEEDCFDDSLRDGRAERTDHPISKYLDGGNFIVTDLDSADLSPCYVAMLKQFQVKSLIVVPILFQAIFPLSSKPVVWGLLIVHQCRAARTWQADERTIDPNGDRDSTSRVSLRSPYHNRSATRSRIATTRSSPRNRTDQSPAVCSYQLIRKTQSRARRICWHFFANLIGNAIKYHDRVDGKIDILATEQEHSWQFSVVDDGPGIAPEHHHKIFGIFQTLNGNEDNQGSGVGLAIVQKLVESRGGSVWVDSNLGKGSTFSFTWFDTP
jgi:Histidine kinase-, DNA gyrase B-, and HSP90-like ATPase/GAF domain